MDNKSNNLNLKKQISFDKDFFANSLSEYAILNGCDILTKEELNYLASKIDWKKIPEFYISGKLELIKKLDWVKFIDKMHALRIAMRDLPNLHFYPLQSYEYEADEIMRSAKIEPDLLEILNIKKGTLRPRHIIELSKYHPNLLKKINFNEIELNNEEAIEIAKVGINEVLVNLKINLEEISEVDKFKVIKAHNFSENSLMKMGYFNNDVPNNYYIREVLINTEDKYITVINIKNLTSYDWLTIVKFNNNMEKYINVNDFFEGDIYFLIELCILFPKYLDYINESNKKRITSLGWEKLLLKYKQEDKLIQLCDFDSLEERTWKVLNDKRPELMIYKN